MVAETRNLPGADAEIVIVPAGAVVPSPQSMVAVKSSGTALTASAVNEAIVSDGEVPTCDVTSIPVAWINCESSTCATLLHHHVASRTHAPWTKINAGTSNTLAQLVSCAWPRKAGLVRRNRLDRRGSAAPADQMDS